VENCQFPNAEKDVTNPKSGGAVVGLGSNRAMPCGGNFNRITPIKPYDWTTTSGARSTALQLVRLSISY